MKIDLNNPKDFTFANVRKLLASGNAEIDMEVRVTEDGVAFLSEVTGPEQMEGISFRIGDIAMNAGDGDFIGRAAKAATDDKLVDQVFRTLKKYWSNPGSTCVDVEAYLD